MQVCFHDESRDDDDDDDDIDEDEDGGRYSAALVGREPTPAPRALGKADSGAAGFRCSGIFKAMAKNMYLSALLLCIPLGFISHYAEWPKWLVFLCNFFAILPMAWLIGKSTEDMSVKCGDILGGLLNATFGNVVEMLLCVAGIRQNELNIVKYTLVGSILSNMLLVLGTSFLWGGYWHHKQTFSAAGGCIHSSLMLLSGLGIILPTVFGVLMPASEAILPISHGCSVLLLFMYLQYLYFQLVTHADTFQSDGDDDDDEADMTPTTAAFVLGVCTVLTACCSEFLISSIDGTLEAWDVSKEFIGIIILPIIGNAAEHYSAILVAGRDKMDLSLGVAVGSSCQMALLVTPFTVIVGWMCGKDMTLDFHPFQALVLFLSVLIVANILKDGESNWLEGSMLVSSYLVIAIMYYFEEEGALTESARRLIAAHL